MSVSGISMSHRKSHRLLLASLLLVAGAGQHQQATAASAAAGNSEALQAATLIDGKTLYVRQCARCHQQDGRGIEDLYPNLRQSPELWTERSRPIVAVLAGRSGPLILENQSFNNVMPTHGYLGNETIASTLTYIRHSWGPGGQPYTVEEVAAERLKLLETHPGSDYTMADQSPLAEMSAEQYVTGDGPPMTVDEFSEALRLYYGHCTACHGVLRHGTAGSPLTPELMRERGTEYLQSVINYGSSSGMPNWGTSQALAPKEINLLARFLQHPVPQPPDMNLAAVRDSWHQYRSRKTRPEKISHDYDLQNLFVVTLHDLGEVAIIDGASKRIIGRVEVGRGPHRVSASASGRYVYVICRDGTLSMIDMFAGPPERVASVRVGYEARAAGASRYPGYEDSFVLAGAYWPPQLVLLDGRTLEPLRLISTRSFTAGGLRYHPEPRVTDVVGSRAHPEFISQIKETGHVYLFPYDRTDRLEVKDLETTRELRAGSFATNGRYFLTPADTNAISVIDTEQQTVVAEIPARVFSGGTGTSYIDAEYGPVWAVSTMVDSRILVVGTDPEGHPDQAWRVVRDVMGPGLGSMFLATHPESPHLWMDTPLSAEEQNAQSIAVFNKDALEDGYKMLPAAQWANLGPGPRRVLQPAFSQDGSEVWLVVWNPQDLNSAVLVIDDRQLTLKAVIRDPGLVTPTRIYSLAALMRAGQPQGGTGKESSR